MDFTLIQPRNTNPSASKLPIKRKTPDPDHDHDHDHDQNPQPIDARAPPFKFHRIWTEPDEIRFLQGLLDCSLQNLAFPRDLGIFYARFSATMSQPYTKSQLSEKLRRLRKKFRVISARLSKGMDRSQLSLHDRALYDISKRLWHPEFAATSPFSGARNVGLNHCNNVAGGGVVGDDNGDEKLKTLGLVGIKVDFSPTLPAVMTGFVQENGGGIKLLDHGGTENGDGDGNGDDEVKLSEVNVVYEGEEAAVGGEGDDASEAKDDVDFRCENEIRDVAATVVINVYDVCFKEVRRLISGETGEREGAESFHARWQRQRVAELDALGSRLRLVLEHSLTKKTES